jgi:nucleoside-diphosphate-sugar epimerase
MPDPKPVVIVTGAAGNLGQRLLSLLGDFEVVAVDVAPPPETLCSRFERLDLADVASQAQLLRLIRESHASAVVHLAFIIDPVRMGVLDVDRMWQINVAGLGRVLDAIAEANSTGSHVRQFVYPSSVSAYGPETPGPVGEDFPLAAHTLTYAVHKREAENLLQSKITILGECSTYVLRPHIYAGATMQNYLIGVLRGTPTGRGRLGKLLRGWNVRLPLVLPPDRKYLDKQFQFVHVDDVARLIAFILHRRPPARESAVLNVPGKGNAVTLGQAAKLAKQSVIPLPSTAFCRWTLQLMWNLGISGIPPEALPYMIGSYTMDDSRLRAFCADQFDSVIQFSVEQALADSFRTRKAAALHATSPP